MNLQEMREAAQILEALEGLKGRIAIHTEVYEPTQFPFVGMEAISYRDNEKMFALVYEMTTHHDTYGAVIVSYTDMYGAQIIDPEYLDSHGVDSGLSRRNAARTADNVLEAAGKDEIYDLKFPQADGLKNAPTSN